MIDKEARQIAEQKAKAEQYVPAPPPEFKNATEVAERLLRIEMGGPSGLTLPALRMLAAQHLALEACCVELGESLDIARGWMNSIKEPSDREDRDALARAKAHIDVVLAEDALSDAKAHAALTDNGGQG